jgi:hypothetical protein
MTRREVNANTSSLYSRDQAMIIGISGGDLHGPADGRTGNP